MCSNKTPKSSPQNLLPPFACGGGGNGSKLDALGAEESAFLGQRDAFAVAAGDFAFEPA